MNPYAIAIAEVSITGLVADGVSGAIPGSSKTDTSFSPHFLIKKDDA